ncbi:MAG: hypothetical protein ABIY62_08020 [Ginsengibacter sp.]
MRLILRLLPALATYMLLVSATCVIKKDASVVSTQNITITSHHNSNLLKARKLNFFQRLMVKYLFKKKLKDISSADKQASTSLVLGIAACGFLLFGLFVPYLVFASVPAAIIAMVTGGSALRHKTTLVGNARTGKGLGLGALIAFGVLLIAAAIVLASALSSL